MIKTKKNGLLKVACAMLVVMMLATCVISGTLAKYASSGNGDVQAAVAKWDIQAGGSKLGALTLSDFTVYDTANGGTATTDNEVVDKKIAPGTWGYVTVKIENKGDVDADITATFTDGGDLPEGMTVVAMNTAPTTAAGVTGSKSITATLNKTGGVTTTTDVVIAFVWVFDKDGGDDYDAADTAIGEAGDDLTLGTLKVDAVQKD